MSEQKDGSGRLVINDREAGLKVDVEVSGVPEESVARRLSSVLELVQYHRFQHGGETDDE